MSKGLLEKTLSEAERAWADLLGVFNSDVARAEAAWLRSRQLLALSPQPPSQAGRAILEGTYDDETDLENQILKALLERGCLAYHSAAESKSRNRRALAGRAPVGWPDITCLAPGGRIVFLEVKTRVGVTSEAQRNMHGRLERLGHKVRVVRSVVDALKVLEATV